MYVVFEVINSKLNPKYLFKVLKSEEANKEINLKSQGAVRKQLRYKDLITIKIPLPPLEVQKQIEKEEAAIAQCKMLIESYEQKIKGKIAEVWSKK